MHASCEKKLFRTFGLSEALVDTFIRPTLLVGLFKPPEELSAAVTMELLYYYALAHQVGAVSCSSCNIILR